MARRAFFLLTVAAAFLAAKNAAGQFVPLSRCQSAYPCSVPFLVLYRPDPLMAGQYGPRPSSAFSLRAPLTPRFAPQIDTSRPADVKALDRAIRTFPQGHAGREGPPIDPRFGKKSRGDAD